MFNLIISCPSDSSFVAGTTTSLIAYSIFDARDATGIIQLHPFCISLDIVLLKLAEQKAFALAELMAYH